MATNSAITPELLDQLLANYEKPEDLTGDDGLFKQLKKALIERALGAELTEHLGYEKGDPAGRGSGNSRNGTSAKTILTEDGEIDIAVPRDRVGSFEPQLIAKGQTRFDGFDGKILSLYARGMTVREIQGHLAELYGTEVSPDLISRVADAVLDEVREWQNRPLDHVYPVVFFDALRVKIRDEGLVKNKAVYVALALNPDGEKDVLGLWIEQSEGAKFWLKVVNELKARGVNDILIAVVDGLKGFPEAITSVYPQTIVQTCTVHLIRNSVRVLERPQGDPACHRGDLPGRERRQGAYPARGARGRMGQALSGDRPGLATSLGARRPSIGVCLRTQHVTPRFGLVLPVLPLHVIEFEITRNGCTNGREEVILAKLREQAKSLQLVLYGIFEFGKTKLDALRVQRLVQFGDHIAGGDVYAGDRLRCDDHPTYGRRRRRHGVPDALVEEFGVGEEQWRIPPEQDQPGDPACTRISCDVVIAFDAVGATQYGGVWPPAIP